MDVLLALAFAFFGAVIASFTLVVAERVHTGTPYLRGRSKCNSCGRVLGPKDLVPILSWLISSGRCFSCGSRIPSAYLLAEATLAGVFALSYLTLGLTWSLLVALVFLAALLFVVAYDIRHTIVPVAGSVLLVVFSVLFSFLTYGTDGFALSLIVAGVIGLGFLALHVFSGGRAMGLGDTPVAFSLALFAGSAALPGLLFSFWIGALFGIAVLVRRRGGPTMGIEVPFVPFLALGFLLAYFTGWNPLLF